MKPRLASAVAALGVSLCLTPSAWGAFNGADGSIAFSSDRDGNREIYLMNSAGGSQTRFSNDPGVDDRPSWSPDSDLLLWSTDRTGNDEVFQDTPGHTSLENLTNDPASDLQPTFTSSIYTPFLFVSNRSGNNEIYAQNRDGTGLVNLTNNPANDTEPSTNGAKLTFVSDRDGNKEIYSMNLDGTNVTRLTNDPATDQAPNLRADGQVVAFESNRDGNFEIYYVNMPGSGCCAATDVSNNPASDREPAWSPSGKVAFESNRDGNFEIYSMVADGTNQTRLTNSPGADVNPDWGAVGPSQAGYPRPKGASPLRASLVPAFQQCTSPDRMHGAPLAFPSCSQPVQTSGFITVGTPDANAAGAHSTGYVLLRVKATDPEEVLINANITDLRCRPATSASVCSNANAAAGPDYSGQLVIRFSIRQTDRFDGSATNDSSTLVDYAFSVNAPVADTASNQTMGGVSSLTTTANAVVPGIVQNTKRSTWQIGQIEVYDTGPDGSAATTGDNTLFMSQGVFLL
jgi:Tol biopolymer transport system component